MEERQKQLLKLVVENYIKTKEPIGSKFLADLGELEVSGATIRNELSELEKNGFLTHPHTSAGRIPTELGYRYYVEEFIGEKKNVSRSEKEWFESCLLSEKTLEMKLKDIAKSVSSSTGHAVIVAFQTDKMYYTGLSLLFSEPEFQTVSETIRVSSIFDHCEEHIPNVFEKLVGNPDVSIFIGSENPLGPACSAIAFRVRSEILFTILGPMRMDYKRNVSIASVLLELISKFN